MLLDSVCRLLLWLLKVPQARGVAPGLLVPHAKGSWLAAMAPLLSGLAGGLPACNHPCALRRWVPKGSEVQDSPDASAIHGGVGGSKVQDLVGREGRNGGGKEEDGVSLPTLTTIFLSAEDLFLQPSQMTSSFS